MATLDWSQCHAVESVPGRLGGAWVFRNTRMPVSAVFENLEAGATVDEITEWFHISKEQVIEVLEFAARSLAAPVPVEPRRVANRSGAGRIRCLSHRGQEYPIPAESCGP